MAKIVGVACLVIASSIVLSQGLPQLPKDPQAVALASQVMAAAGSSASLNGTTSVQGTILFAQGSDRYPIRIYTLGNNRIRTEIDRSNGTSVRIVNSGEGSFQSPNGKVIRLNPINLLAERVWHFPVLSIISDFALPDTKLEYVGPVQEFGVSMLQFRVSWSDASNVKERDEFLKRTKVTYSIDPATFQIIQVQFDRCAERDTNSITHYRMMYSDYRNIGGRTIATKITTFANEVFSSELQITSLSAGGASSTSFDPQEATK